MLQGDSADNIPGLEKYKTTNAKGAEAFKAMGPKTAEELLDGLDWMDCYLMVARLYYGFYGANWNHRFAEQAALLWMRPDQQAKVSSFKGYLPAGNVEGVAAICAAADALEARCSSV
jgi:DNA polymerase-1